MLQAVFDEAETRARRVVEIATLAARPEPRDHARLILEEVVPEGRRNRTEIIAFADKSTERIREVLRRNDLTTGHSELAAIQCELLDISGRAAQLNARANTARAAIQLDLAKIDKDVADLRVRVSARAAEAALADEKSRQRAARSAWTWFAGPLGKAIDELVGLIQDGGLTESTAKEALQELVSARSDVAHMEAAANSLTLLTNCVGDLTNGLQGLMNAIAVALGHAQNAQADLSDVAQLDLFCRAAILDLENLRQDAD